MFCASVGAPAIIIPILAAFCFVRNTIACLLFIHISRRKVTWGGGYHALFVTLLVHVTFVFFLILSVKERSSLFLTSFNVCHLRFRSAPCRPVSVQFRLESDTAIRCIETCRKWAREALISRADAALRPAKWQGWELIELAPQSFW